MRISICSFSFHRLLKAGKQDIFQYIDDCRTLGCTQLDPWSGHFTEDILDNLPAVKAAADRAGLPFGCIAVDGAHIYEEKEEDRIRNRENAYRWIAAAEQLGASQVRIDAGGPEDLPPHAFEIIVEGYRDLIERAEQSGVELLMENHWGPSRHPENVVKILEAVPGLGLLLDSWNWAPGKQAEGWLACAKYAKLTHIKTFHFTEDGQELTQNIPAFVKLLQNSGYTGCWGIESVPRDGDEMEAARKTVELIRRAAS